MIRFLVPLLLLAIVFILARRYIASSNTVEQKKSRKITVVLVVFAIGMVVLALFHRMHWVGAVLAALAPLVKIIVASIMNHLRKPKPSPAAGPSGSGSKLTEEEALQVLGLKKPFTEQEVIEAHRKLMQKFHPDRGGNDYLAARINQAKEVLLK